MVCKKSQSVGVIGRDLTEHKLQVLTGGGTGRICLKQGVVWPTLSRLARRPAAAPGPPGQNWLNTATCLRASVLLVRPRGLSALVSLHVGPSLHARLLTFLIRTGTFAVLYATIVLNSNAGEKGRQVFVLKLLLVILKKGVFQFRGKDQMSKGYVSNQLRKWSRDALDYLPTVTIEKQDWLWVIWGSGGGLQGGELVHLQGLEVTELC